MRIPKKINQSRSGLTLVEVVVSTVLVGLVVVGALRCLGASIGTATNSSNRTLGMLLAEDLMEEILQQEFAEPDDTSTFGVEGLEVATLRALWDDVDDYDGWSISPPEDMNGNAIADDAWTRSVTVENVQSTDLSATESDSADTGVKRITVSVDYNGVTAATLTSVQTRAWISMIPDYSNAATTGQLPPANEPPAAQIDSHLSSGTGTVAVSFDGGNSSDPEDQPLEYNWDFGDGNFSTEESLTHTFTNAEATVVVFTVTLTVLDIHGGSDSGAKHRDRLSKLMVTQSANSLKCGMRRRRPVADRRNTARRPFGKHHARPRKLVCLRAYGGRRGFCDWTVRPACWADQIKRPRKPERGHSGTIERADSDAIGHAGD